MASVAGGASFCGFCRSGGRSPSIYYSHTLRSPTGVLTCFNLRKYVCPICGETGDNAHTVQYCPANAEAPEHKRNKFMTSTESVLFCGYCYNNGMPSSIFNGHSLRSSTGKLTCPTMRTYVCPNCGARGDRAHSIKYCPWS
ncbi:nanos homolog 1-like [Arctopsyche grandis]|uniref:nanos homolog 1-like n=1 Tax=Arctopsyche grandis TaxID=121162 RepID=UPI00406D86CC